MKVVNKPYIRCGRLFLDSGKVQKGELIPFYIKSCTAST